MLRAERLLDDAQAMIDAGRLESAADRAYYAMFHAVHAALSLTVARLPRTHSGTRILFTQHFVATGRLPAEFGRSLAQAFDLRQVSTYEVMTSVGEEGVREVLSEARRFVAALRSHLAL